MLELVDVHAGYGNTAVLHDVSLRVDDHEIVTIVGANGAGKTTTMMTISGIVRASRGTIRFDGREIQAMEPHAIARAGVAHVAQQSHLFKQMTVEENLRLGSYRLARGTDISPALREIFEYFPVLGRRRTQRAGSLSGGEQKMLAVGRALVSDPRILLLDEPSAGLSPLMVKDLARVIRHLRQDRRLTTLIVEQNAVLAFDLADRGYLLESGRIVTSGKAADLRGSDAVRVAYLGL